MVDHEFFELVRLGLDGVGDLLEIIEKVQERGKIFSLLFSATDGFDHKLLVFLEDFEDAYTIQFHV